MLPNRFVIPTCLILYDKKLIEPIVVIILPIRLRI